MSETQEKGWGVYPQDNGDVVVLPLNDSMEHDMLSSTCKCMPFIETYGANIAILHNAFDFRHVVEWLNRGRRHNEQTDLSSV